MTSPEPVTPRVGDTAKISGAPFTYNGESWVPAPVDAPAAAVAATSAYTTAQYSAEPISAAVSNGETVVSASAPPKHAALLQAINAGLQPTQVKHPWRTTLRTFIQNLPTIAVVIAAVTQAAQDQHVGWVEVWGPSAIAVSVLITRVMAIPAVNDLLTKIGVGAAPAA